MTLASPGCSAKRRTPSTPRTLDSNSLPANSPNSSRTTSTVCSSSSPPCVAIPPRTPREAIGEEPDAHHQAQLQSSRACDSSHAGGDSDPGESQARPAWPDLHLRLSETLGVTVRFNNINMEGMYQRGAPPRIHLSARRPLTRGHRRGPRSVVFGVRVGALLIGGQCPGGITENKRQEWTARPIAWKDVPALSTPAPITLHAPASPRATGAQRSQGLLGQGCRSRVRPP
jgi:hypothetical protein